MVLLTGLLAFCIIRFSAPASASVGARVALAVLGLAGAYGVACGGMVLSGAGLAILFAAPFWLVAVLTPPPVSLGLRLMTAAVALILSVNVFLTQSRDTPLAPPPRPDEESRRRKRLLERWEGDRFEAG